MRSLAFELNQMISTRERLQESVQEQFPDTQGWAHSCNASLGQQLEPGAQQPQRYQALELNTPIETH